MTAEIAIMNKEGIALATDSAVTMQGEYTQKIFTSANKLFALSKYHPVGMMIYGSAIFMGIPWEIIIKEYRKKLGKNGFSLLKDYANDFIKFLDSNKSYIPATIQEEYLKDSIHLYFLFIREKIEEALRKYIEENGNISFNYIKSITSKIISEQYMEWNNTENIPSIPKRFNKEILNKYEKFIEKSIKNIFERLPLSKEDKNRLKKIASDLFSKFPKSNKIKRRGISGIVIAGFGDKEIFPSLESFHIECKVNNRLKYEPYLSDKIDFKNSAAIIPFAQSDVVYTFMEGINPNYKEIEEISLNTLFKNYAEKIVDMLNKYRESEKGKIREKLKEVGGKIIKGFLSEMYKYRKEYHINSILSVVSMLPKDELAAMAESFVNLTSFKKKVSMESETVGGPIDVSVISKGDGFIWIKRKHYFKADLNQQFFANYYKENINEKD